MNDFYFNLPPALSREEDLVLVKEYRTYGDKTVREKLVLGNLRLVFTYTNRFGYQYLNCWGNGYPSKEDLFQEGVYALIKCIENYNIEEAKFAFSTYVCSAVQRAFKRVKRYAKGTGGEDHFDDFIGDDDSTTKLDLIADKSFSWDNIEDSQEFGLINETILPLLSKHERDIFNDYIIQGKTLQEVADDKNLTREAIRLQADKILEKVKRMYFEGISEEDIVTRGVKLTKSARNLVLNNAALIKQYGRKFLMEAVIPSIKEKNVREIYLKAILRYDDRPLCEIARELSVPESAILSILENAPSRILNIKRSLELQATGDKVLQEVERKNIAYIKKALKYKELIDKHGGELILRKFFMPQLYANQRKVFEMAVLEYDGQTNEELMKIFNLKAINSLLLSLKKILGRLDKFDGELYKDSLTEEQLKQDEFNKELYKKFGKKFIASYINALPEEKHRKLLTNLILRYKGDNILLLAQKAELTRVEAEKVIQDFKSGISSQEDKTKEKVIEKIAPKMTLKQRQRLNRRKRLVEQTGGELFLRRYFLPYLTEQQKDVFEAGILEYEGEKISVMAYKLKMSPSQFGTILHYTVEKLKKADFEKLVTNIDNGVAVDKKLLETDKIKILQKANERKSLIDEFGGIAKVKKYFLPALPKQEREVFELRYLTKAMPTTKQVSEKLEITEALVLATEKKVIEKLKQTNFEELVNIRQQAENYVRSLAMKKSMQKIHGTKPKVSFADQFGGKEFLVEKFLPTIHVPVDKLIFERYVINEESTKTIGKDIKPKSAYDGGGYVRARWTHYILPKMKEFKESIEDFDAEVRDFYVQKGYEEIHGTTAEEIAFGARVQKKKNAILFTEEQISAWGGAKKLCYNLMPTMALSDQVVFLKLMQGESPSSIRESCSLDSSEYKEVEERILKQIEDFTSDKKEQE